MSGPPERHQFQYAVIRVVPRIERGECVNAGVVLLCRPRRYLGSRTHLDETRLRAVSPDVDLAVVAAQLEAIDRIAAGDESAGPIARLTGPERFHWLVAPSSTIIQPSAVHTGLCEDPAAELEDLYRALVL